MDSMTEWNVQSSNHQTPILWMILYRIPKQNRINRKFYVDSLPKTRFITMNCCMYHTLYSMYNKQLWWDQWSRKNITMYFDRIWYSIKMALLKRIVRGQTRFWIDHGIIWYLETLSSGGIRFKRHLNAKVTLYYVVWLMNTCGNSSE